MRRQVIALFAASSLLAASCGDTSDKSQHQANSDATTEVSLTIVEPSEVKAELGGAGFEDIASELGFSTNSVATDKLHLYGSSEAKTGGSITSITTRFPLTMRPGLFGQNTTYTENDMISKLCYQYLMEIDHVTMGFLPQLASHWKISEDRMTYTYRIDPRARFADGSQVTAEDVAASWRLIVDDSMLLPFAQETFGKFFEPKVLSPFIVEVKCRENDWHNFIQFSSGMSILPAQYIKDLSGTEFIEQYHLTMPPGSGEYEIKPENVKNQNSWLFTRRTDYWGSALAHNKNRGNFDTIKFEVVKDNPTLEYQKYLKGEQDFFYYTSRTMEQWVHDGDNTPLQNGWTKKMRVHTNGPAGTWGIHFNMRKAPFNDIRVRKAFALAFNREKFIEEVLYNEYATLDSYFDNSVYRNPDLPLIRYNPEEAAKLLAAAGWDKRNADGWLVNDAGQVFVVEMGIIKPVEKFVTPWQQELRKLGVKLELKFQDQNTLFESAMNRSFVLYWNNLTGNIFPNPKEGWDSKLAEKDDNWNIAGVNDPRLDSVFHVYDNSMDQRERIELIRSVDAMLMELMPEILLYRPQGIKIGYWDKFGMPDYVFYNLTQPGDHDIAICQLWWYDESKAQSMQQAQKDGTAIGTYESVNDVRYWKEYQQ